MFAGYCSMLQNWEEKVGTWLNKSNYKSEWIDTQKSKMNTYFEQIGTEGWRRVQPSRRENKYMFWEITENLCCPKVWEPCLRLIQPVGFTSVLRFLIWLVARMRRLRPGGGARTPRHVIDRFRAPAWLVWEHVVGGRFSEKNWDRRLAPNSSNSTHSSNGEKNVSLI